MPRIKSTLNGEISNVRGDIAKELIRMGVAVAIDPLEEEQKGNITVASDGTVHAHGERYRIPKYQPADASAPQWDVLIRKNSDDTKTLVIRMTLPNLVAEYFGSPADVNRKIEWPGGFRWANGFGRAVPDEILSEYNRQYKRNADLRGTAVGIPTESTGPSNETMAANKEAYDREIAHGNASPGRQM